MKSDEFRQLCETEYNISTGDPAARALFDACLATLDEIERLEEALAEGDVLMKGERGQVRANPIYDELRKHRTAFARLSHALFGEETPRQRTTRQAAQARWSRAT